jgi:hypothetical protein
VRAPLFSDLLIHDMGEVMPERQAPTPRRHSSAKIIRSTFPATSPTMRSQPRGSLPAASFAPHP